MGILKKNKLLLRGGVSHKQRETQGFCQKQGETMCVRITRIRQIEWYKILCKKKNPVKHISDVLANLITCNSITTAPFKTKQSAIESQK